MSDPFDIVIREMLRQGRVKAGKWQYATMYVECYFAGFAECHWIAEIDHSSLSKEPRRIIPQGDKHERVWEQSGGEMVRLAGTPSHNPSVMLMRAVAIVCERGWELVSTVDGVALLRRWVEVSDNESG